VGDAVSLDQIEIETLVLRAPGLTTADAHELAAQVAEAIHRRLGRLDGVGHVHLAELRLRLPTDAPRARWPELIADRLIESLAEARHGG